MIDSKVKFNKKVVENLPATKTTTIYWDTKDTGFGVRVQPTGVKTFFFQGRSKCKLIKITIGRFGVLTVEQARDLAKQHAADLTRGIDPRTKRNADEVQASFGDMLNAYVELLYSNKKYSAKAVESAVQKDVRDAFPKLYKKAAIEITLDDCVKIIKKLVDEGKPRQADKLRSYIRTTFSKAINSRGDAKAPATLRESKLTLNPALQMGVIDGANVPNERVLEKSEFQAYWSRIKALEEPYRSVAMLHVLTGGQRLLQLRRATINDVDITSKTLTLWDSKGRRKAPRRHEIPLLDVAIDCIKNLTVFGDFVLSCTGGLTPISDSYLNNIVKSINVEMEESGELLKGRFTAKHIRATIETRLVDPPYYVISDVLAQLLSHGLGGVQNKNYQRNKYTEGKLDAIEKLYRLVEGLPEPQAQVIPMRAVG